MVDPVKEVAKAVYEFVGRLADGQIRKMYERRNGDVLPRAFPISLSGHPGNHINQLFSWAVVTEYDRRDLKPA